MGCFCGTHENQRKTRPRPCLNLLCSCLSAQAAKHIQRPQTKIGGKPQKHWVECRGKYSFLGGFKEPQGGTNLQDGTLPSSVAERRVIFV